MTAPKQIATVDIPRYRSHFAKKNKYTCPICKQPMGGKRISLDHCHSTGKIRDSICQDCNRTEGMVKKAVEQYQKIGSYIKQNPVEWLKSLIEYLEHHRSHPSTVIHPSFDLDTGRQRPTRKRRKVKGTK